MGGGGGGCHYRTQKSLDFQGPSLPMELEMDLPAWGGGGGLYLLRTANNPPHAG
jgi:hypothetical protein